MYCMDSHTHSDLALPEQFSHHPGVFNPFCQQLKPSCPWLSEGSLWLMMGGSSTLPPSLAASGLGHLALRLLQVLEC